MNLIKEYNLIIIRIILCIFYFGILALSLDWVFDYLSAHFPNMSDAIYIESLYRDIFIRHLPINGWLVSRAPFFFPDWLVYFIIRACVGNYGSAWYFYLLVNLSFLILFFYGYIRLYFKKSKSEDLLFSISWASILILLLKFTPVGFGPHTILLPVYHSGALINGLIILWVWNCSLVKSARYKELFFVGFLSCLATLSDEWWIIWFGLPIGLTSLLFMLRKQISFRNNFIFLFVMGSGVILGELLVRLIQVKKWLYFSQIPVGSQSQTFFSQVQLITQSLIKLFSSSPLLLIAFLTSIILCISTLIRSKQELKYLGDDNKITALRALHFVVLLSFVFPFFFIIPLKMWGDGDYRYFHNWIYLPWLIIGLNVLFFARLRKKKIKLLYFLNILPIFFIYILFYSDNYSFFRITSLLTQVPYRIPCIDEVARTQQLKYGISEYWEAKSFTEQNHSNIFINQFTYDFNVLHWMNNLYWYTDKKNQPLDYDFVIIDNSSAKLKKTQNLLGKPTIINICDSNLILIYKNEANKQLNEIIRPRVNIFLKQPIEFSQRGKDVLIKDTLVSSNQNLRPNNFTSQPAGINSHSYYEWNISKSTSDNFLEDRIDLKQLQGKQLIVTFWAKIKEGNSILFSSTAELTAETGHKEILLPLNNDTIKVNNKWQHFIFLYEVPDLINFPSGKDISIRALLAQNANIAADIDIADLQFLLQNPNIENKEKLFSIKTLEKNLQLADQYDKLKQFNNEFIILKENEFKIWKNTEQNSIYHNDLKDTAELNWRFARLYYNLSGEMSPEEKTGYLLIANESAMSSLQSLKTANTEFWSGLLLYEIGKITNLKIENESTTILLSIIQKAMHSYPSNPEFYELIGKINYTLAEVSDPKRALARILFAPYPNGSLVMAKNYFLQAHQLDPSNKEYKYWLAKTVFKMNQKN